MIHKLKYIILALLLAFSSCREKPVTLQQVSENPEAQLAFDTFLNSLEDPPGTNDTMLMAGFNTCKDLLDNEGLLLLYRKMGEFYYNNEIADSVLVYFIEGKKLATKFKNDFYLSVFHLMTGSALTFISDFEPALAEMKEAYRISMTLDSTRLQVRTSRNLGNVYWNTGNYDLALDYYLISLEISQTTNHKLGIASALNNIGNVYQEVKNYDRAVDYYKQAAAIATENDFARVYATASNNIGDVYLIEEKFDSALVYIKMALDEVNKVGSRFDAGIYIGNLAEVYLKKDSLDLARKYFLESLDNAVETGDKIGIASCNLGLAKVYLKRNDPDSAAIFLRTSKVISEEIGSLKLMENSYELYARYFLLKNDYPNSHHFLLRRIEVKDSISSLESGENVARLENRYKEVQTAKEIEILKERQKGFIYLSVLGFIAAVTIALLIYIAYRQKTRSNLLLKEKNQQIEASREILERQHLQLLDSQEKLNRANKGKDDFLTIISHDLKNPLSSIRGFTELLLRSYDSFSDNQRKDFLNEVFDSIERISLLINNILFWVKSQTDGIQFKPAEFNLYRRIDENISIYRLMLANKNLVLDSTIDKDTIVVADHNVFDMVVRNILSNALKFTPAGGKISFASRLEGKKIRVMISDTGIGIPEDKIRLILSRQEQYTTTGTSHEQGTGLGLGLVYQFVRQSGEDFTIDSSPGKGTTISFTLNNVSPS